MSLLEWDGKDLWVPARFAQMNAIKQNETWLPKVSEYSFALKIGCPKIPWFLVVYQLIINFPLKFTSLCIFTFSDTPIYIYMSI
jgi:hypothetical protein